MQVGGYKTSTTIGFNPQLETATFQWILSNANALALYNQLISDFNAIYSYTCPVRGPILIRPTDTYSLQENVASNQANLGAIPTTYVTMEFDRVYND
jgi:hypothetical protein